MEASHDDDKVQLYSRLLIANQRRIYGFILTLVHDRAAADDILQDVSSILWQKFDKFEPGTDFAAWAMSIARFTILNWRRKQKHLVLPLDDQQLLLLADEAVAVSCEYEERRDALRSCLRSLSGDNLELLQSRYEMNQAVSGIAERMGRSRVAVYKRLTRIQGMLLDCINDKLGVEQA